MSKIVFSPPGPDAPGFLKRLKRSSELFSLLLRMPSAALIEEVVEYLLPHVKQPEDQDEAREALWDATNNQFREMLVSLAWGDGSDPLAETPRKN